MLCKSGAHLAQFYGIIFDDIKCAFFADKDDFNIRSYGMSGDYSIAIQENSNMVRVGTRIFGPRKY